MLLGNKTLSTKVNGPFGFVEWKILYTVLGGADSKCSQVISILPFSNTDIHLGSGGLSTGAGKTVTLIVENFIPLAGQKSSLTLIKKV